MGSVDASAGPLSAPGGRVAPARPPASRRATRLPISKTRINRAIAALAPKTQNTGYEVVGWKRVNHKGRDSVVVVLNMEVDKARDPSHRDVMRLVLPWTEAMPVGVTPALALSTKLPGHEMLTRMTRSEVLHAKRTNTGQRPGEPGERGEWWGVVQKLGQVGRTISFDSRKEGPAPGFQNSPDRATSRVSIADGVFSLSSRGMIRRGDRVARSREMAVEKGWQYSEVTGGNFPKLEVTKNHRSVWIERKMGAATGVFHWQLTIRGSESAALPTRYRVTRFGQLVRESGPRLTPKAVRALVGELPESFYVGARKLDARAFADLEALIFLAERS